MSRRYSSATITLVILFCRRPHCRKISVRQYYQKRVIFIQLHFSALRVKMPLSYAGYHHFIMMSLVSGEHNTPALSLQDESPVWCLRADVAAELRSLRRSYHLSNGMESKSVDTRSIYRELGATLSYNMRTGNGMEMNHG